MCISHSVMPDSWWPVRCGPPGSSVHGILGKNTGVGCHSLLQGIFLTQGSNPGVQYCRQILYHLSLQGNQSTSTLFKSSLSLVRVSGRAFNTFLLSPLPFARLLPHPAPPQFFQHNSQTNFFQNKYDTLLLKTFWDS